MSTLIRNRSIAVFLLVTLINVQLAFHPCYADVSTLSNNLVCSEDDKIGQCIVEQENQANNAKFETNLNAFREWINSGSTINKVAMKQSFNGQRGVFGTHDILANEKIISISKDMLVTVDMGKETPVAYLLRETGLDRRLTYDTYAYLPIFILEDREDEYSSFKHYYSILPKTLNHIPLFWKPEELDYLTGSPSKDLVIENLDTLQQDYNIICEASPEFGRFSFEDYKWAYAITSSRVFGLTIDHEEVSVLVPYGDLLNHRRPRQTGWEYDNSTKSFTIRALEDIPAGNEIFISYGRKSNHLYLTNYGFTIEEELSEEKSSNLVQLDYQVDFEKIVGKSELNIKKKYYGHHLAKDYFNARTQETFSFLRLSVATVEELATLKKDSNDKEFSIDDTPIRAISWDNEGRVLKVLEQLCLEALQRYPTTLEEDIENLKDMEKFPLQSNQRNALVQVKIEKDILHYYIFVCNEAVKYHGKSWKEIRKISFELYNDDSDFAEYFRSNVEVLAWLQYTKEQPTVQNNIVSYSPDVFDENNTFEKWLKLGSIQFHNVVWQSRALRGIFSSGDIKANEVITSVPRSLIISIEVGKRSPVGTIIRELGIDQNLTANIGLYFPILILVDRETEDSPYVQYYRNLPINAHHMPTFWNQDDLNYLNGSYLLESIQERIEFIKNDYDILCSHIPQFKRYSLNDYLWAHEMAISRNFNIKVDGKPMNALVPVADLFNHAHKGQADWDYDEEKKAFVFSSLEDVKPNQEIFTSYGTKSNGRFLLSYGFSVEDGQAPDNGLKEMQLSFNLISDENTFQEKHRMLQLNQKKFLVSMDQSMATTKDFFTYLRILVAEEKDFQYTKKSIESLEVKGELIEHVHPISADNELRALDLMGRICNDALSAYPTTIEEDLKRLADTDNYPRFTNKRNGILQVKGEKEVLSFYIKLKEVATPLLQMDWRELKGLIKAKFSDKSELSEYVKSTVGTLVYKKRHSGFTSKKKEQS